MHVTVGSEALMATSVKMAVSSSQTSLNIYQTALC
jgi:hypothetical protein